MKEKLLYLILLGLVIVNYSFAQTRTISGKVTAQDDGLPLPGATVTVKGTSTGVQTGSDGTYRISLPNGSGTLVFNFIGFASKEVAVTNQEVVNVVLSTDTRALTEVVVTALGITRQEKTLGYSATTVRSDDLTAAKNVNVMSGVQGKVAGVAISNAGAAGGSTKVIIRGVSSFNGGNNPLYVVDGVPINNTARTNTYTGGLETRQFERSLDFGNQADDINPEDVESVTILKGASATALYGSRAAHGVVMVTTKSGKLNQKLQVVYTGAYNNSNVLRVPQTQNMFGQGWPFFDNIENGSWGPKLSGRVQDWGAPVDGVSRQKAYSYVENNVRDFYDTGNDFTNSISLSGGGANNSFAFTYSNTGQNGVVPTDADKFSRNNFSLRGNSKYGKFESNYSLNYVRRDMNMVFSGQGTSDGGATLYQELLQIPVDIPLSQLKDYRNVYNNEDNYFTAYAENPYFILDQNGAALKDDRVFGKLDFSYGIARGLKAVARIGGDFANARIDDHGAVVKFSPGSYSANGGKTGTTGRYSESYRKDNQIDANLLLQGDYNLTSDISLGGVLGYNYNQRGYTYLTSSVSSLDVPEWYSLANTSGSIVSDSYLSKRRLMAGYGSLDFGFKDFWFVNLSLRNDWSSTLPKDNRSYFYSGINTSLVVTDWFKNLQNDKLSFLKLRGAWGQTGTDADPYLTRTNFITAKPQLPFGDVTFPIGGIAGVTESNNQGNQVLKPEITTEFEVGLDTRWFNSRVGLDLSFYNRKTKDQIISANFPAESGYSFRTLNVGNIQNRGFEAQLSLVPVKTRDFRWELATNFTTNKSKVLSLYGGAQELLITSAYSVDYVARVGEPLGIFRVPALEVVQSGPFAGKTVVAANGFQKINNNAKDDLGTSNPDFIMGFNNSLSYKNFSLGAVVDWRKGGKFYSYTKQLSTFVGNDPQTTFNQREPFLVPNSVKEVVTGGLTFYVENNIGIPATSIYGYWYGNTNQYMYRNYVIDRDYVKLRELVFTYSLPKALVTRAKLSKVDFSLIGRNLLLFTPKSNNVIDPEGTNYGNDITSEFGEFGTGPTMRTYGASLKVTF
ncbi:MAG: hypothetical protein K0S09_1172 [Sphingobacteriaceae bacterium]|nr:hypothetical protein [Sphingobacteriaceae bacterium]